MERRNYRAIRIKHDVGDLTGRHKLRGENLYRVVWEESIDGHRWVDESDHIRARSVSQALLAISAKHEELG